MVTSDTSLFSQNAYVNINRIMSVASRLAEAGHYASTQIKQISAQLDQDWKSFAAALDERSTILAMSSVFHQKAEQVRRQEVPSFTGGSSLPVASRGATMSRRSRSIRFHYRSNCFIAYSGTVGMATAGADSCSAEATQSDSRHQFNCEIMNEAQRRPELEALLKPSRAFR